MPLEESMATPSSILAWRIPRDREAWWAIVHGGSGTNRKGCKNNRPLMLHKRGSRKVCPDFFPDTLITYSVWFLRFPVLWVKTERLHQCLSETLFSGQLYHCLHKA